MDDRKFREIMEDYARSTAKGKETDFAKANAATKAPRKKINLRWVTAVCSVVIIVAVSLAVALPLTLGGESPNGESNDGQGVGSDTQYYCKSESTVSTVVDSFETLQTKYGVEGLEPSIEAINWTLAVIYSNEFEVAVGSSIELMVFNERFSYIKIKSIKERYILEGLSQFEDLDGTTNWRGDVISYSVSDFNNDGYFDYRISFTAEGYNYFIELDCYGELDVATVLDMIYG